MPELPSTIPTSLVVVAVSALVVALGILWKFQLVIRQEDRADRAARWAQQTQMHQETAAMLARLANVVATNGATQSELLRAIAWGKQQREESDG